MKIAYFDCFAGAAGDMIVAAMLDAGLDSGLLMSQIDTLGLKCLKIEIEHVKRLGLRALRFTPVIEGQQQHRSLSDISDIIKNSGMSITSKQIALSIFEKLAGAEAFVHGKKVDEIHFHEVGAVDSIVDVVSASIGLDHLKKGGIEKIYCSPLSIGGGTIECEHGVMPVPAPATAELLKGIPANSGPVQSEVLTPTAAAILITVVDRFCFMPSMKLESIGYGAGTKDFEKFPNILRLFLGRTADSDAECDSVCLLETNIDDASGELLGDLTQKLLSGGALDVFTTPVYAKNNRPAVKISILCRLEDNDILSQMLLLQGVTFGVREQVLQRRKLARKIVSVETQYGTIRIKVGSFGGRVVNVKPEFSDCAAAAEKLDVPVKDVLKAAMEAYRNKSSV